MAKRRILGSVVLLWAMVSFLGASLRVLADCAGVGLPFNDLGSTSFCAAIAEAYYTGLTNGTGPTTFSPGSDVTRVQTAAFVTRTLDASLYRGSRRAALGQWWNSMPHFDLGLWITSVGVEPGQIASDGADVWTANGGDATVSRVRASDGKLLDSWTGAIGAGGIVVAMGRIFITGKNSPGTLYMVDPTQPAGAVTTVANTLDNVPIGLTFDGQKFWTASSLFGHSVSIVTPGPTLPWPVTIVSAGFINLTGILFDGNNIWVADVGDSSLKRLNASGQILQTIPVGASPWFPTFDGHNIWVPVFGDNSVVVVRASDGVILKTFSDANGDRNGLSSPRSAAFDGRRVLVTNQDGSLSLFEASSLNPILTVPTGLDIPYGACSDGVNFWVSFLGSAEIGRY